MSELQARGAASADFVVAPRFAPNATPVVTAVRGTALMSSIKSMAALGMLDAYGRACLRRAPSRSCASSCPRPGSISLAHAHSAALDALDLSDLTREELAKQAGGVVEAYLTGTIVRMSRGLGGNPWRFPPHAQRLPGGPTCVS